MQRRDILGAIAGVSLTTLAPAARAQSAPTLSAPTLSTSGKSVVADAQTYLNNLTALTANFLQVAADGSTRTGKAWLQRPGKMRFQYDPPDPQLLVAGFGLLVYNDPALAQTTNIPLASTPLGILLAQHVVLSGDITVTNITQQPGENDITVIRTGKQNQGSLTLVFGTNPLELRQWVVTDAQQRQTRVSLYDIAPAGPFPDSLFTFQGQNPIASGG